MFSLAIQGAVIAVNALIVYHWRYLRAGRLVASYGFPVWLSGTIAINLGVSICGFVVIGRTGTVRLAPRYGKFNHLKMFRVQEALEKEGLPAFMIQHHPMNRTIMLTRSPDKKQPWLASFGAFLALGGFVCQNIGTRELHLSSGLLQLGATLILTIFRALLRRRIGNPLSPAPLELVGSQASAVSFELERRELGPFTMFPIRYVDNDRVHYGMFSVNSRLTKEEEQSAKNIFGIWENLSQETGFHDEEGLKEIDDLVDDLIGLMRELTDNQSFEWNHPMSIFSYTDVEDRRRRDEIKRVQVECMSHADGGRLGKLKQRPTAIFAFSNYDYRKHYRGRRDALQILGRFKESKCDAAKGNMKGLFGSGVEVWVRMPNEDSPEYTREIFGLEFSTLQNERYISLFVLRFFDAKC